MSFEPSQILPFEAPAPCGLRQAMLEVLEDQTESIQAKKLQVELEFEHNARFAECGQGLAATLERLVSLAVSRSPFGSTLMITVLVTHRGVEIEVADEGPQQPLQARPLIGFGSRLLQDLPDARVATQAAADERLGLYCGRCPQGGLAWTVVVQRRELNQNIRVA